MRMGDSRGERGSEWGIVEIEEEWGIVVRMGDSGGERGSEWGIVVRMGGE